jgi:O-antigen/teichoic acid export membrane protein
MLIQKPLNYYKKLSINVRSGLWYTVSNVLQKGLGFITIPIFTRILTTEQYGTVSLYYSWRDIVMIFCTFNLFSGVFNNGMVRYEDKRNEFLSSIQSLITILSILFFLLYLSFYVNLNKLFGIGTILVTFMFTDIVLNAAVLLWSAKERFENKYAPYSILIISSSVFSQAVTLFAIYLITIYDKAALRISTTVLSLSLFYGYIYILNFIKGKCVYNKEYWSFALWFNVPLILHYLSTLILTQSGRIMIAKMVGTSEAGIYSLSQNIAMMLTVIIVTISNAYAPWLYKKLKNKDYESISTASTKCFLLVGIMLFIVISVAPEIMAIMGPGSYQGAIMIIPPLASSLYFVFAYMIFANIEFYFGKNLYVVFASTSGAVLNIGITYIGIKHFGYIAAGYTALICYIIFGVAHYFFMKKTARYYIADHSHLYNIKSISIIGVILLASSGLFLFLYGQVIIRLLILALLFIAALIFRKTIIRYLKSSDGLLVKGYV